MNPSPADEKQALRRRIVALRNAAPAAARREWDTAIGARLLALNAYQEARVILAYAAFGSEFDPGALIAAALAAGKRVALPRVTAARDRLEFCFVSDPARDLAPGAFGIPEPRADCPPLGDLAAVGFVLAPGVAYTRRGGRLGYGGGYYDRFLAALPRRTLLVGAAYALQLVAALPLEAHDRRVTLLVTENETIVTEEGGKA